MKNAVLIFIFCFTIKAFGQDISCFLLEPPEKVLKNVEKIAILDFDGKYGDIAADKLITALSISNRGIEAIKGGLFSKSEEGKTYLEGARTDIYTLIERSRIKQILKEQNFSASGLIDEQSAAKLGHILGVDAIISGTVKTDTKTNRTREKFYDYINKKEFYQNCFERKVTVDVSMRIVNVNSAQIMGTKQVTYSNLDKKCGQEQNMTASEQILVANCINSAANNILVKYLSPIFVLKEYEVMEIDVDEYEDLSDEAIDAVDNKDYDQAFTIYSGILKNDPYNDVVHYNLGILYEIVGDFNNALENYNLANKIKSDEEYQDAIQQCEKFNDFSRTLAQIGVNIKPKVYNISEVDIQNVTAQKVKLRGDTDIRINVYVEPQNRSKVMIKVPGGMELELVEKIGDWLLIKTFDGKQGYIKEDDID